jgi:hypothetical protein
VPRNPEMRARGRAEEPTVGGSAVPKSAGLGARYALGDAKAERRVRLRPTLRGQAAALEGDVRLRRCRTLAARLAAVWTVRRWGDAQRPER